MEEPDDDLEELNDGLTELDDTEPPETDDPEFLDELEVVETPVSPTQEDGRDELEGGGTDE